MAIASSLTPRVKLTLAASFIFAAFAQTANAENLVQIYALSQENDPKYQAARLEYQAVGFEEDEAFAGFLPVVSAEVDRTTTRQNILSSQNKVFATGTSSYPTSEDSLSLTQPLFKLAIWRRYQQAESATKEAAATYAASEQDLIVRTASAYVGVLAATDALGFTKAESDSIKESLDLAQGKYSSGQATVVNLRDAEARYALKQSDIVMAQNELDDRVQALREITGREITDLAPVTDHLVMVSPDPLDMKIWIAKSIEQNMVIEAQRQAVEVARGEIEKQRAAYYPTLSFALTNDRKVTGGSLFGGGADVRETDGMLQLSIPIYDGGATRAVTRAASARYDESQQELEKDVRSVERQTRAAYQGITGSISRVKAIETSVGSLQSASELKEAGFKAGLTTVVAVLDANRDLFAARRDLAQAKYDFIVNMLKLKQAAGILSQQDLFYLARATQQ